MRMGKRLPMKSLKALNSCGVVLSELYGITSALGGFFNSNDNSVIDVNIINTAASMKKQVVPIESLSEHNSYAVRTNIYPYYDFHVGKYPIYYNNVIIGQRNIKWMNYIVPYVLSQNTFIAVGVDHVRGIINMLASKGCKITRM